VDYAKQLLEEIGIDSQRLEMFHIGASDAPNWARAVREMTERARNLGPNPLRPTLTEPMAPSRLIPAEGVVVE
jgi:F420-non-reducing hydrogenase iron-sulfur subunit